MAVNLLSEIQLCLYVCIVCVVNSFLLPVNINKLSLRCLLITTSIILVFHPAHWLKPPCSMSSAQVRGKNLISILVLGCDLNGSARVRVTNPIWNCKGCERVCLTHLISRSWLSCAEKLCRATQVLSLNTSLSSWLCFN